MFANVTTRNYAKYASLLSLLLESLLSESQYNILASSPRLQIAAGAEPSFSFQINFNADWIRIWAHR